MPITVICPKCSAKLNAPDTTAGKRVKCPKPGCGTAIQVPEADSSQFEVVEDNPSTKATAKKSVTATVEEDLPPKKKPGQKVDVDKEDEKPRSKRRREEEEELPQRKKHRDEDDDYERDRPLKKKKRKKASGLPPAAIAGIVLGGLLVLGGMGYGIYALSSKDPKTGSDSNPGGGSNSQGKPRVPVTWVEYKSEAEGFRASFPLEPKVSDISGGKYKLLRAVDKNDGLIFNVFFQRTPIKNVETADGFARLVFSEYKISVLSTRDATLSGLPAMEYSTTVPSVMTVLPNANKSRGTDQFEGRGFYRVIVTDKAYFMSGIESQGGTPSADLVRDFFDKFELLK
jgi:hypothetical protein